MNDFFLASSTIGVFKMLKKLLAKEYKMINLREVKTIVDWQITRNTTIYIVRIN